MSKCPNCGASMTESKCAYCGFEQPQGTPKQEQSAQSGPFYQQQPHQQQPYQQQPYQQQTYQQNPFPNPNNYPNVSPKSKLVVLLLWFFFGVLGFHRFYAGHIGTGILYLFTGGICGIGWIVDLILIVTNGFKDSYGRPISRWN